jgi:hypothetical protein
MKILSILALTATLGTSFSALATRCAETDVRYWQNQAEELISTRHYRIRSTSPQLAVLELAVVQNAFVTGAYARLYQNQKVNAPDTLANFMWLGGAAFASFEVGQVIRHSYYAVAAYRGINNNFRPTVYGKNSLSEVVLGDHVITEEQIALKLIQGNLAIYRDIYWQQLAATECGLDTIIRVVADKKRASTNPTVLDQYGLLESSWQKIKNGQIMQGTFDLTNVEQRIVLQPRIYEGVLARVFGRLFAKIAVTPLKDPNFSFPTFVDYCREHRLTPNFSNFQSRWPWIVDQMREMERFFTYHQDRLTDHHNRLIHDGRTIVGFLNDPSMRFLPARFGN